MKTFTTTTVVAIALSAFAPLALADNCNTQYNYCGSGLLKKGKYSAQIDQALRDHGYPLNTDGDNFLFKCLGGPNGDIQIIKNCVLGCHDSGSGSSDYCK